MNQKVLQTLEFDKIINILTGYATTELGKSMCANLKPMQTWKCIFFWGK